MKTWTSTITYSVFDMGRECETEEDYIEWVKETFREDHNIELRDDEITEIEFEEVDCE
jgi:lipoate-protein ligase A